MAKLPIMFVVLIHGETDGKSEIHVQLWLCIRQYVVHSSDCAMLALYSTYPSTMEASSCNVQAIDASFHHPWQLPQPQRSAGITRQGLTTRVVSLSLSFPAPQTASSALHT